MQTIISKSDFLLYLDAPRHLWAKKHGQLEDYIPSAYDQHLMAQGQEIEKWAVRYIQDVILPQYNSPIFAAQRKFIDNHFEVIVDGLVYDPDSEIYDLYEIKSSTSVTTAHIYDVAFQTLVCKANIPIGKTFLVHLNKDYIRDGEVELDKLFVVEDLSEEVASKREEILILREQAWRDISLESYETVQDCLKPNDCPCKKLCHPNLPADPIYNLPRLHKNKARDLKSKGKLGIKDIPDGYKLSDKQQLHVDVVKSGKPHLDSAAVESELAQITAPIYFLDYETYNPGIPWFDDYRPYQQIVFQYSLHIVQDGEIEIEHFECLETGTSDSALGLLEKLTNQMGGTGSVVVWNKSFEAGRNREMGILYPQFKEFLDSLNDRMFDLAVIFQKGYYVHSDFFGSYSIKKVLPVLAPDVSYDDLSIPDGTQAMLAWAEIMTGDLSRDEIENSKGELLAYCKLDTFAMIRIWQAIQKILEE